MSTATPGTTHTADVFFALAITTLIIGSFTNPLALAAAFTLAAVGFATRRTKQQRVHGILVLVLLVVASGYMVGKDMAHRDNALPVSASA